MRITKKVLAKLINDWFNDKEMPYEVSYNDIEPTRFTRDQYEGGATLLYIIAKHKTDKKYSDIQIFSMYRLYELQKEMKQGGYTKIHLKDYSRHRLGTFCNMWIEPY